MDCIELTKYILNELGNNHTKVDLKEDLSGNYYNVVTDTIYLAPEEKVKNIKNIKLNHETGKLITLCHECYHSIQNKILHRLNTVLSISSILLVVIFVVMTLLGHTNSIFKAALATEITFAIVIRCILELSAIANSVKIAKNIHNKIGKNITNEDILKAEQYMRKYTFLAMLGMIADKLVMLAAIVII